MREARMGSLLTFIIAFVFIAPLIQTSWSRILIFVLLSGIIINAVFAIGIWRTPMVIAAVSIIVLEVIGSFTTAEIIRPISSFLRNLFFLIVISIFVFQIATERNVTVATIFKVLNGYLLVGIVFTSIVAFISGFNPEWYNFAGSGDITLSDINYYTFVTLTTVGYGDLLPVHPVTKSLAMAIAISGQFYVAIIVAMIVGKFASQR